MLAAADATAEAVAEIEAVTVAGAAVVAAAGAAGRIILESARITAVGGRLYRHAKLH
jgi:hypothetical protein